MIQRSKVPMPELDGHKRGRAVKTSIVCLVVVCIKFIARTALFAYCPAVVLRV